MPSFEESRRRTRWAFGPIAGVLVAGCFSQNDGGGCQSPTSLTGNGNFHYVCTRESDGSCDPAPSTPPPVVVGGTFGLTYMDNDDTSWPVQTVSNKAVDTIGTSFRALRAGRVGFFASDKDVMIDAIRLRVAEPASFRISDGNRLYVDFTEPGTATWSPSTSIVVLALPQDADGISLGGAFQPAWTVDDPTIVSMESLSNGRCKLTMERVGETVLHVAYRSASTSLRVVVQPEWSWDAGATDGSDDASAEGDASEDAGNDAGDDAATDDGGAP